MCIIKINADRFLTFKKDLVEVRNKKSALMDASSDDILYKITISPTREIVINDVIVVSTPVFGSENFKVLQYLMNHPYQEVTLKQFEKTNNEKLTKNFHRIVENLGFTKKLRSIFFEVSKSRILFKNPILKKDFQDQEITQLRYPLKQFASI